MAMQLNEKNFSEEVLKSDVPVLVDFWAEWCMPCKMLAPVIEELSSEANGTYKVAKVNVDEAPSLAAQYEVMSIPTVLVFRNGQITNKSIGVVPKASLLELLKYNRKKREHQKRDCFSYLGQSLFRFFLSEYLLLFF